MDATSNSKHHPEGGARFHCDNGRLECLISAYQATRDVECLSLIIELTQDRALTLIRFGKTTRYRPEDELLSEVNYRLLKAVDKFDPAKGTAFTFVSQVIMNTLRTTVTVTRRDTQRRVDLDEAATSRLVTNGETHDHELVEDFAHRLKLEVRTTLANPAERAVQRWYVESFTEDGFHHRRHECANAAMVVHSLTHDRSRELYDLTMLEVRRLLYGELITAPRATIIPGQLVGTREAWMTRFAPLLSTGEFTKFFNLMRGISPFVLMLVAPGSTSRRQDRNPEIVRQNLLWVLNGHPDAVRLFQ